MNDALSFSALAENDLFRSAFKYSSIGMALVAIDGTWLEVNDALCGITGYAREELQKITFRDITHSDDLEPDLANVNRLLAGEIDHFEMEKRYIHKNGAIVWAMLSVTLVRQPDGKPRFFISQIQDITKRKEMEIELKRRKNTLKSLLNNTQTIITRLSRELKVTYVNSAIETYAGVKPSAIIGNKYSDLGDTIAYAKIYEAEAAKVFETGEDCYVESERKVDGQTAHFVTHITPETDESGVIESVLGVTFNITKLKNTEKELRKALAEIKKLRAILPICSYCKNIRDDKDYWQTVENYISTHTDTKFSHSICPDCYEVKVKPQLKEYKRKKDDGKN